MFSRRDFLKFSGLAGASQLLPDAIQRAMAIEPAPGSSFVDAEHVVILMQENRSFDHMFGRMQGVRGFDDPRAMRRPDGRSILLQQDAQGRPFGPWRLNIRDSRITWMGSIPHSRESQVDAWNQGLHDRWIEAKRSGDPAYADIPMTMGHYQREDLPFYYALADAFTVCDQHFCGVMSSTTPNRLMHWTGTIRDRQQADSQVFMRNEEILLGGMNWTTFPERLQDAGVSWGFYQNELDRIGEISADERAWLSNYSLNVLEYFDAFEQRSHPGYASWLRENLHSCEARMQQLEAELAQGRTQAAGPLGYQRQQYRRLLQQAALKVKPLAQMTPRERALYERAFITNVADPDYRRLSRLPAEGDPAVHDFHVPKGDILHQFRQDVRNGKLPTVSWLAPPQHFSDHPSSPWYGAWYVSEVMNILTENPEVWKRTIFLLTYDENDGYYDHVASFVAPDPQRPHSGATSPGADAGLEYTTVQDELAMGVPAQAARGGPIGLGYRVPLVVASPWSRGGWVNSQVCDHSSSLQFLETFLNRKFKLQLRETQISPWRRSICSDLSSCFHEASQRMPSLPFLARDRSIRAIADARLKPVAEAPADAAQALLDPAAAQPRRQEPGVRPSAATGYDAQIELEPGMDGQSLRLKLAVPAELAGRPCLGMPFNIALRGLKPDVAEQGMRVGCYTVAAGESLDIAIPLEDFAGPDYAIDLHGPNGCYRQYRGRLQAGARPLQVSVRPGLSREQLVVTASGPAGSVLDIGERYGARHARLQLAGAGSPVSLAIPVESAHRWYELNLACSALHWQQCHAGRLENGQPGVSDPLMGGMLG